MSVASLAVGDFNGDGVPDLVFVDGASGNGQVWLGNANGTFTQASGFSYTLLDTYNQMAVQVLVADFNGDGKADIAVASSSNDCGPPMVDVLFGNGNGTLNSPNNDPDVIATPCVQVTGMATGDFRNNGKTGLAVITSDGYLIVSEVEADGKFVETGVNYFVGPVGIVAGDFNGDGITDLAIALSGGSVDVV
jgi:hypothetical protein